MHHRHTLLVAIVAVITMIPATSLADGGGRVNRTLKSSTSGCGSCHGSSASAGVVVAIDGPDTLIRNQQATYTLTISGGPGVDAGCDIATRFGTVGVVSSTIKLSGTELTHKSHIPMSSGSVSIQFSFTPSGAGASDTIYATGISTNGSGSGGDQWNWSPKKVITVLSTTDVGDEPLAAHAFALSQNYPNPFNPRTSIRFEVPRASYVTLKVYDMLGREAATLVSGEKFAGSYEAQWDASRYSSGVYIYRLQAGSFVETRKLSLMK